MIKGKRMNSSYRCTLGQTNSTYTILADFGGGLRRRDEQPRSLPVPNGGHPPGKAPERTCSKSGVFGGDPGTSPGAASIDGNSKFFALLFWAVLPQANRSHAHAIPCRQFPSVLRKDVEPTKSISSRLDLSRWKLKTGHRIVHPISEARH